MLLPNACLPANFLALPLTCQLSLLSISGLNSLFFRTRALARNTDGFWKAVRFLYLTPPQSHLLFPMKIHKSAVYSTGKQALRRFTDEKSDNL